MTQTGTSTMTAQRIERLLRSLVGVSDLRLMWTAQKLRAVHIMRDSSVQPHQLIRNVVSGLQAGFGIVVLPTQVFVHDDARIFDAVSVTADVLIAPVPANGNGDTHHDAVHTNGNGNGDAPHSVHVSGDMPVVRENGAKAGGNGHAAQELRSVRRAQSPREVAVEAPQVARPSKLAGDVIAAAAEILKQRSGAGATSDVLQLERIDVERRGGALRCRTVLSLGGRTYSAIAEVPDSPSAEAELAARVAVDALRAGGLTMASLEGVGFITISDVNYCIATVREPGKPAPRAGAAPLIDSMAASATAAVLTALGTYTDVRVAAKARAGY